ncbi:hypothetical protein F5B19DRAFT_498373 [Rostrohypoxylon terebratum]|nr:hypothetical protein F5B19DRAFT_498373 [Rostrohypoxylon terebratum]
MLRLYIDSRPKVDSANSTETMYAQLVKKVRIYTKSQALSTGAILVDIPDTPRSNSTQEVETNECFKSTASVWVVVPGPRLVTANSMNLLFDEHLERQLNYDGLETAITLIISKMDDIRHEKGPFNANAEKEVSELRRQLRFLKGSDKHIRTELHELIVQRQSLEEQISDLSTKNDLVAESSSQPSQRSAANDKLSKDPKRIRDESPYNSRKALKITESTRGDGENLHDASKNVSENDARIDGLEKEVQQINIRQQHVNDEINSRGLNDMKDHLRRDLVRQYESEIEINNIAGYKAKSTKFAKPTIFSVSSKAYSLLCGEREDNSFRGRGYISTQETEIPQLQDYTMKTTEAERVDNYQIFFNDFLQLVNSIALWLLRYEVEAKDPVDDGAQRFETQSKKDLETLEKALHASSDDIRERFYRVFDQILFRALDRAGNSASANALYVARRWGAPRSEGGIAWSTYRATARRNGCFHGTTGTSNFNEDLFVEISIILMRHWKNTFQERVPSMFQKFSCDTKKQIEQFEKAAKVQLQHTNTAEVAAFFKHLSACKRTLSQTSMHWRKAIIQVQRDSIRMVVPSIRDDMMSVYQACAVEGGEGCFKPIPDR